MRTGASAPRSNNVNRIRAAEWRGVRVLFLEEKFLNQEINRNDVDGGEKMASFR